jgi:K+-sensing histidine kinase KdpD
MGDVLSIATPKGVHVFMELDLCPELVAFDQTGIERVIMNLIDNACRYTPTNGSIRINGYPFFWERRHRRSPFLNTSDHRVQDSRLPNCYRVDVHNTGPRIPEQSIEYIFEEYAAMGEMPDQHSAGLGLAICRSVLALHAGHIWAENRFDGPVFSFVIPFAPKTRQLAAAVADHRDTVRASA